MKIVTLTTDYGCRDYYAGALKSKLLQVSDHIHIVDITHEIDAYHLGSAAFQVSNAYPFFPNDTLHFIDVSFSIHEESPYILMRYASQFFVSCDNGIFSLILDGNQPEYIRRIYSFDIIKHASFPALDVFPAVLNTLDKGLDLDTISEPFNQLQRSDSLKPIIYDKMIRASVLHIDKYENIILNIKKDQFEKARRERKFVIQIRRGVETDRIHQTYTEADLRDVVALFNANNFMEISLREGNFAGLNNVSVGDSVQIDFL
jgi:S-adenosylmethionine hydrolase